MLSAVHILHNCAKATENRQVYRDLRAVERLVPFLKAERMEVVVVAILTLSYITDESQQNLLEADSKVRRNHGPAFRVYPGEEAGRGTVWDCSTLSPLRLINVEFLLQPHQKYYTTHEQLALHSLSR